MNNERDERYDEPQDGAPAETTETVERAERAETTVDAGRRPRWFQRGPRGDDEARAGADSSGDVDADTGADTEADILRSELQRLQEENERLEQEVTSANERHLRARAELETMRRRMQGEAELARERGVDSALLPALRVYDDLERALDAAAKTDDPSSIVPGVRTVKESLLRDLGTLGVELVGQPGERFDPNLHEALTVVPLRDEAEPGTIDQVFEAGFVQGERLVRVARVTVFADEDGS